MLFCRRLALNFVKTLRPLISPNVITAAAVILLCQIGVGGVSGSPQLHLDLQPDSDSLQFRLTGLPVGDKGEWVLQSSSAGLNEWEDLAFFDERGGDGADLELELAFASIPDPAPTRQFFRARYLNTTDRLLREFVVARDTWRRSGVDRYTIETRWFLSMFVWHGTVSVFDHEVTSSETIFSDFFEVPEPKTIDDWFDQLKRFIDQKAEVIVVSYDPVFGYPKSVSIDESLLIADEEQSWSILDFRPKR